MSAGLHNLNKPKGATHRKKRLGAGESSGQGKTSGKGHKGQKSRSGGTIRPGFEGGQMPLFRRLPKRGFTNGRHREDVVIVNIADLKVFENGATVDEAALREKGLVKGHYDAIKLLGEGALDTKLTVKLDKISESAQKKIEEAGGSVELVDKAAFTKAEKTPRKAKKAAAKNPEATE
jgi:large subunit ribosomal protein L15